MKWTLLWSRSRSIQGQITKIHHFCHFSPNFTPNNAYYCLDKFKNNISYVAIDKFLII